MCKSELGSLIYQKNISFNNRFISRKPGLNTKRFFDFEKIVFCFRSNALVILIFSFEVLGIFSITKGIFLSLSQKYIYT